MASACDDLRVDIAARRAIRWPEWIRVRAPGSKLRRRLLRAGLAVLALIGG
ncbi:MAG TPA: hypothetical protein VG388_10185 [Solirubrobacteraceae bacterium]|nr:hypothetical protein [Solirubrobacteraceae bacterium]